MTELTENLRVSAILHLSQRDEMTLYCIASKACSTSEFLNELVCSGESEGGGLFGIKWSNIDLDSCNLVQMLLDIVMPEIRNINTIAFHPKLECQDLSRLIIFGSPFEFEFCHNLSF